MEERIVISDPQEITKDCYAPAPKIDLTLRSNGEEQVMVMDSLGTFHTAGLKAPTAPPIANITTNAGSFPSNKYWAYRYVYVAKRAFPLVENAITGDGSPAPRSNPSPSAGADSATNTNKKDVRVIPSKDPEITHIWIYRTPYLTSQAQATDASTAGQLFWVAEVINDPNVVNIPWIDDGSVVGLEQIENDNFPAPQFKYCVYSDPYFWGIGNDELVADVIVTATGAVTIDPDTFPQAELYNGRDGQIAKFAGINGGGFDNLGSFYIKITSKTTAQLYLDIGLNTPASVAPDGYSRMTVKGPSSLLFRSKPRNPLAWGYTDLIGEIQVPSLYFFSVGGGKATAIAVIPNLNLLKIDTSSPNRAITLNLKNAGTPNFETSMRIMSDQYCVGNHHTQFTAIKSRGEAVLWGIDSKSTAIVECDGSTQQPISGPVFQTMRSITQAAQDQLALHGVYDARSELNLIFIQRNMPGGGVKMSEVLYMHAPTGYWGKLEFMDILCASQVHDIYSGELKTLCGTASGMIGEMFAPNRYCNWFVPAVSGNGFQSGHGTITQNPGVPMVMLSAGADFVDMELGEVMSGLKGNWVTIHFIYAKDAPVHRKIWLCRISDVAGAQLTFDKAYQYVPAVGWFSGTFYTDSEAEEMRYYIGLIELVLGKTFTAAEPFDYKKVEEVWTSWVKPFNDLNTIPTIEFFSGLLRKLDGQEQTEMVARDNGSFATIANGDEPIIFSSPTNIPVDQARQYGIILRDRSYSSVQLLNYELRMSIDGTNS